MNILYYEGKKNYLEPDRSACKDGWWMKWINPEIDSLDESENVQHNSLMWRLAVSCNVIADTYTLHIRIVQFAHCTVYNDGLINYVIILLLLAFQQTLTLYTYFVYKNILLFIHVVFSFIQINSAIYNGLIIILHCKLELHNLHTAQSCISICSSQTYCTMTLFSSALICVLCRNSNIATEWMYENIYLWNQPTLNEIVAFIVLFIAGEHVDKSRCVRFVRFILHFFLFLLTSFYSSRMLYAKSCRKREKQNHEKSAIIAQMQMMNTF